MTSLPKQRAIDADQVLGSPLDGLGTMLDGLGGAAELGISKSEYFSVIGDVGKKSDSQFPLVFMEACESELAKIDVAKDATDYIGLLYNSDVDCLDYTTIKYADVFKDLSNRNPLPMAMHQVLFRKYELDKAERLKKTQD